MSSRARRLGRGAGVPPRRHALDVRTRLLDADAATQAADDEDATATVGPLLGIAIGKEPPGGDVVDEHDQRRARAIGCLEHPDGSHGVRRGRRFPRGRRLRRRSRACTARRAPRPAHGAKARVVFVQTAPARQGGGVSGTISATGSLARRNREYRIDWGSLVPARRHWINPRCPTRGHIGRNRGDGCKQDNHRVPRAWSCDSSADSRSTRRRRCSTRRLRP